MEAWTKAVWWAAGALACVALGIIALAMFRDRSRGRRRCPRCWYDMSGAPSNGLTCPECGKTQKNQKRFLRTRRRWRGVLAGALLLFIGVGTALAPAVYAGKWLSYCPTWVLRLGMLVADLIPPDQNATQARWLSQKPSEWDRLRRAWKCSAEIRKALKDPDAGQLDWALYWISDLEDVARVVVPDLNAALRSHHPEVQLFGVNAKETLGSSREAHRPVLRQILESTGTAPVRLTALRMLRTQPDGLDEETLGICRRLAREDRDGAVQFDAAAALLLEEPQDPNTLYVMMLNGRSNPEPVRRLLASRVLGWYAHSRESGRLPSAISPMLAAAPYYAPSFKFPVPEPSAGAVDALADMLRDPDAWVRREAADVLSGLDGRAAHLSDLLSELAYREPVPEARRAMMTAYTRSRGHATVTPEAVREALASEDAAERERGVDMLAALRGQAKLDLVRGVYVASAPLDVRRGAVWSLLSEQCLIAAVGVCVKGVRDEAPEVREVALRVLRLGVPESEAARGFLEKFAEDPDLGLREAARHEVAELAKSGVMEKR